MLATQLFKNTTNLRDNAFIYQKERDKFPVILVAFAINGRSWLCDITYLHLTQNGIISDVLNVTEAELFNLVKPLCDGIEGIHQLRVVSRGEAFAQAGQVIEQRKNQKGSY